MSDTVTTQPRSTMHVGPLGSTVHVLYADPGTIAALATVDWNRSFGRVWLDSVRGLVALMAPSLLHDELAGMVEDIVQVAGSVLTGAFKGLRSTRLRGPGDPPGTGMEPDCAFYFGERARRFREARMEGIEVADAFIERNAPDLVVEVEITNADEGKIERYGEIGVRELWRLHGHKDTKELRAEFLALHSGHAPRALAASEVLQGGLTPSDLCEAVEGVRPALTRDEQTETVARIVHRRRDDSARVREEGVPYALRSA